MYTVNFMFEYQGDRLFSVQDVEAGQTILEVALNNQIPLKHICGGICSCTSCHVFVVGGMEHLDETSRRERDFLGRLKDRANSNSRLACQTLLLEGEGVIRLLVPAQIDKQ